MKTLKSSEGGVSKAGISATAQWLRKTWADLNDTAPTPYRQFFTLGLVLGIASIGIWSSYSIGIESLGFYPGFHHVFGIVSLFLGSFILGFLLTALPRFTATKPAKKYLVVWLGVLIAGELYFLIANDAAAALFVCALKFLSVEVFAVRRLALSKHAPPPSFVWIGVGLLCVVLGALGKAFTEIGVLQSFEWSQWAHLLFTRAFILSLFMGIGSRLFPALSGVTRVESVQFTSGPVNLNSRKWVHALLAAIFVAALGIESFAQSDAGIQLALFMQFMVVAAETIALWKMYRRPEPTARAWMLSISAWSMVIGFLLAALLPYLRLHLLHVVYLSGFLGGTLAIGAHVLVNHEAMDQRLLKTYRPLGLIMSLIAMATILRVGAIGSQANYAFLIGLASILVVLSLAIWGGNFVAPLWKNSKPWQWS